MTNNPAHTSLIYSQPLISKLGVQNTMELAEVVRIQQRVLPGHLHSEG
jgi:hypothetical protein